MYYKKENWYAVYSKPRWEKKVYAMLTAKGMEAYCQLNRTTKKWSDRHKMVEEPLFKSYVFVKVKEQDLPLVRLVNGVVNFVYWLGKPAIVADSDIEIVRRFLNEYTDVFAEPLPLTAHSRIKIPQPPFMKKKAKVAQTSNNKFKQIIQIIVYPPS